MADLRSDSAQAHHHLLIAGASCACGDALAAEALKRGASVATISDIGDAVMAVRSMRLATVVLFAGPMLNDTLFAIQQFRKFASGCRIMLLVLPGQAAAVSRAVAAADEAMLTTLSPRRMADTIGIISNARRLFEDEVQPARPQLRLAA